ncbi:hypothetical protein D9758_019074 [Tetrapyrgos nigripes]|uniref:RNase H type-1 domain-containing protein n=1 Tax=Tetrapyrgos nigripes TaxID=182062 RepID=A0A8H5BHU5_9AGAR|nr:hypothetical protein D9758_019074 [Tetrapyrgos nigripes]
MCQELVWMADHMEQLDGVRMLQAKDWGIEDAELILFCDACPVRMGFWCELGDVTLSFQCRIDDRSHGILYFEALAVLSALSFALQASFPPPSHIVVFTDNSNTVNMFNSLKATPTYNPILMTAVDLLLQFNAQLRVFHIPGTENHVADSLSHFNNDLAYNASPSIIINPFTPPRVMLGAELL